MILDTKSITLSNIRGDIIPTQIIDGEKIPTQIDKKGWIFDPDEGERIQGKYIFGQEKSIYANDLVFSAEEDNSVTPSDTTFDESIIVLIIIIVGGIGAALFFLKGYKK